MDIARGPEPATLDVAQDVAPHERTPASLQAAEVPATVAALPQDERRSFESMNTDIDRQLASVSSGSTVPPALAGALAAQAQVYESLGLEAPQSHADVRARLAEPAQGEPARGNDPALSPDDLRQTTAYIRESIAQGRGDISDANRDYIDASIRGLQPEEVRSLVATLSVEELGAYTAALSRMPTAEKTAAYDLLANRLGSGGLVKLAQGLQAGSERRENPADATDGRILGRSIATYSGDRAAFVMDAARLAGGNSAVGLAAGHAFIGLPSREVREQVIDQLAQAGTLDSLIEGSVYVNTDRRNGWEVTVDSSTYEKVMLATSYSSNDLANGQIVDAAARQLARVENIQDRGVRADLGDSIARIRGGITSKFFQSVDSVYEGYGQLHPNGGGPLEGYYESMGQSPDTARELTSIRQSAAVGGKTTTLEFQEGRTIDGRPLSSP